MNRGLQILIGVVVVVLVLGSAAVLISILGD
jgi:hypothetical protein